MPTESVKKLTSNSHETQIRDLLGNGAVFEIPFFQRPYKWADKRLKTLNHDLLTLVDGFSDLHFLGAIILFDRASDPSSPNVYEVIDGQQRLTTIYLHLCAAIKTLLDHELFEDAERLFRKYLVTSTRLEGRSNLTLQPSKDDRADLNAVIREILDTKDFQSRLEGVRFYPLSGSEQRNGRVQKNFRALKRFYAAQVAEEGIERAKEVYSSLLQKITVVQIVVNDPTSGPSIFDSLNSQQEPMTVGDLVRNDVFNRVAREDPDLASELDEHNWRPFYEKFRDGSKDHFDSYFFPFGLIHDPNLRKSEAYTELRRRWNGMSPTDVINDLATYQDEFLDLVRGTNVCNHPVEVSRRLQRLYRAGAPSSTYPFLMRLSRALRCGETTQQNGTQILDVIDSFLTRRAICGYEPTGLHAVFKKLWVDCGDELTADRVATEISKHKTVAWPSDDELADKVKTRPLYGTSIARYVILEYDETQGGDKVPLMAQIEHVLPRSQTSEWPQFSSSEHEKLKHLFANLLPLSAEMNVDVSNSAYAVKRPLYAADSVYKSTRLFAAEYDEWSPETLHQRGEHLALWAVERWPHKRASD